MTMPPEPEETGVKERRSAVRVDIELDLELRLPGRENAALGKSMNFSHSGIYFRTEYFMEEGTKLPLSVHLPAAGPDLEDWTFRTDAIVVRCQPPEENPLQKEYRVACFFYDIEEEDRERLEDFVRASLKAH